jgi:acyl-CoA thioesterase-1
MMGDMKKLWFVWLSSFVALGAVMIGCATPPQPGGEKATSPPSEVAVEKAEAKTILVLGDSLAAGFGVQPGGAFPALIQEKIDALGWNFQVVNAGVSGDTSSGGLGRIDWLLKRQVDVLLVELGGNDGLRGISPDVTRRNLQAIIEKTRGKYPEAKIVVAGMKMPPNLGLIFTSEFESVFPDVAKETGAALIPFLLEGVAGEPALNLPDRIHPTPEGHQRVADNVWEVLRPVLESMRRGR